MNRAQSTKSEPRVSVGMPLYKSRGFLANIIENVEAVTYGNVEIFISDRHCEDDAIDVLQARYRRDPRVRFIKKHDRIDWVAHYNDLLRRFTGKYFLWMPHDDIYPSGYIDDLVACMEEHPDAVCAFGKMEAVDLAGSPLPAAFRPPPLSNGAPWSFRDVVQLCFWGISRGFRGLFRREPIVEASLFIRPTVATVGADHCWLFGLALTGRFCFVSRCVCRKRYYPQSTSARWRVGAVHLLDWFSVLRSYLKDARLPRGTTRIGMVHILVWTVYNFFVRAVTVRLPLCIKEPIKKYIKAPVTQFVSKASS